MEFHSDFLCYVIPCFTVKNLCWSFGTLCCIFNVPLCVSGIWTSLTWLWWFGLRLEPIWPTAPAASINTILFKGGEK